MIITEPLEKMHFYSDLPIELRQHKIFKSIKSNHFPTPEGESKEKNWYPRVQVASSSQCTPVTSLYRLQQCLNMNITCEIEECEDVECKYYSAEQDELVTTLRK